MTPALKQWGGMICGFAAAIGLLVAGLGVLSWSLALPREPEHPWIAECRSDDPRKQAAAVKQLRTALEQKPNAVWVPKALQTLALLLRSPDETVRYRAQQCLVVCGSKAVPTLLAAATQDDRQAAVLAIDALRRIGPAAAASVATLRTLAAPENPPEVRVSAVQAIWEIEQRVDDLLPALVEMAVAEKDASARGMAVSILYDIRAPAVPHLRQRLSDKSEPVIRRIFHILTQMGPPGKAALPEARAALQAGAVGVRLAAARAVWNLDQDPAAAVPVVLEAARNAKTPKEDREEVWRLLKELSRHIPVPDFVALFKSLDEDHKLALMESLPKEKLDQRVTQVVFEVIKSRIVRSRCPAELLLIGQRDCPLATAALAEMLESAIRPHDGFTDYRWLQEVGSRGFAPEFIPAFAGLLEYGKPDHASEILSGIAKAAAQPEAVVATFLEALKHPDQKIQAEVLNTCRWLPYLPVPLSTAVRGKCKDSSKAVRSAAVVALVAQMPYDAETHSVLRAMLSDPDVSCRAAAAQCFSANFKLVSEFEKELIQLLHDPKAEVRAAYVTALSRSVLYKDVLPVATELLAQEKEPRDVGWTFSELGKQRQVEAISWTDDDLKWEVAPAVRILLMYLVRAIRDDAKDVQVALFRNDNARSAMVALLDLAPHAPGVAEAVAEFLLKLSEPPFHSESMEKALGRLGPDAAPVVTALQRRLKDDQAKTRAWAAAMLGSIGPAAHHALPALLDACDYGDLEVRISAAEAVWRIDRQPQLVIPVLLEALEHRSIALNRFTVLREMGPEAKAVVPVYARRLRRLPQQSNEFQEAMKILQVIDSGAARAAAGS